MIPPRRQRAVVLALAVAASLPACGRGADVRNVCAAYAKGDLTLAGRPDHPEMAAALTALREGQDPNAIQRAYDVLTTVARAEGQDGDAQCAALFADAERWSRSWDGQAVPPAWTLPECPRCTAPPPIGVKVWLDPDRGRLLLRGEVVGELEGGALQAGWVGRVPELTQPVALALLRGVEKLVSTAAHDEVIVLIPGDTTDETAQVILRSTMAAGARAVHLVLADGPRRLLGARVCAHGGPAPARAPATFGERVVGLALVEPDDGSGPCLPVLAGAAPREAERP